MELQTVKLSSGYHVFLYHLNKSPIAYLVDNVDYIDTSIDEFSVVLKQMLKYSTKLSISHKTTFKNEFGAARNATIFSSRR